MTNTMTKHIRHRSTLYNKKMTLLPPALLLLSLYLRDLPGRSVQAFLTGIPSAIHRDVVSTPRSSTNQVFLRAVRQNENSHTDTENPPPPVVLGVVAPLVYRGPYPCVGLRFPDLRDPHIPTPSNNPSDDDNAVVLYFMIDTGANVNSLASHVIQTYHLSKSTWTVPPPIMTAGMGGQFSPGDYYLVGNCGLAGLPPGQRERVFMTNLTAAVLPRNLPPDTAGLLGASFLGSLAGVEFDWYGTDGDPPTLVFYFGTDLSESVTQTMMEVPMKSFFQLSTVPITIHGVTVTAMIDTGSPITVLSYEAAEKVGISIVSNRSSVEEATNDSANFTTNHSQSVGDPVLHMGGVDGRPMTVLRSQEDIHLDVGKASLGEGPVYVGNIPALKFFQSLPPALLEKSPVVVDDIPVAILGLDWLKQAYRIIVSTGNRNDDDTLWVEELDDTKKLYQPEKETLSEL